MLIRVDILRPWQGELLGTPAIRYPLNIEGLWTAPELLAIGLVKAIRAVIPVGFRATGPATYAADGTETIPVEPIPPPTPEEIAADKEATLDRELVTLGFKVLFDHENRVRALEGKAPITAAQFRAALKARL